MILRLFLLLGLVLLGGTGYFIVVDQPPTVQKVPETAAFTQLREEGTLPSGDPTENEEIEHDVFETPAEDEAMLEAAMSGMGDMAGTMDMTGGGEGMDMTGGGNMAGTMDTTGTDMAGTMDMAGDEEAQAKMMAQQMAGFVVREDGAFDREVTLNMSEWTFSDLDLKAKAGERIRFTIRNDGKVLHEFMFMTMAQMQAIEYRAQRADWNLLEHEALYEKSLLVPGQEISFVAEVTKPGSWMFMCMLPYHMQMGMMGQISTPGAGMKM